jgi:DNA-binding CsgD family transcriptional regulator
VSADADRCFDLLAGRAALVALHERERVDEAVGIAQRAAALRDVREAVRRLGEIGSPDGLVARAPEELGRNSSFDRVLISRLHERELIPHVLWERESGDANLPTGRVQIGYPLVELEAAEQRRAVLVDAGAQRLTPVLLRDAFRWLSYVVAPIVVNGIAIGLLHADATHSGRALTPLDREVAAHYGNGLAHAYELVVLRHKVRQHRDTQLAAVRAMNRRIEAIDADGPLSIRTDDRPLADPLTSREQEVLDLLGRGMTNAAIASRLVVSDSTVKFHVKNVLRKLGATSRADAVARAMRSDAR